MLIRKSIATAISQICSHCCSLFCSPNVLLVLLKMALCALCNDTGFSVISPSLLETVGLDFLGTWPRRLKPTFRYLGRLAIDMVGLGPQRPDAHIRAANICTSSRALHKRLWSMSHGRSNIQGCKTSHIAAIAPPPHTIRKKRGKPPEDVYLSWQFTELWNPAFHGCQNMV